MPNSSRKKLTRADLKGFSKKKLKLARNEIYARHGRKFVTAELRKYFKSKSWYKGTIEPEDFVDSKELSKLERRNAKFLLDLENK